MIHPWATVHEDRRVDGDRTPVPGQPSQHGGGGAVAIGIAALPKVEREGRGAGHTVPLALETRLLNHGPGDGDVLDEPLAVVKVHRTAVRGIDSQLTEQEGGVAAFTSAGRGKKGAERRHRRHQETCIRPTVGEAKGGRGPVPARQGRVRAASLGPRHQARFL